MMIAARNAMLMSGAKPYDAEVEYIESTGTQCVNAEIPMNAYGSLRTVLDVSWSRVNSRQLNGSNGYYYWGVTAGGALECVAASAGAVVANRRYSLDILFDYASSPARYAMSVDGALLISQNYAGSSAYTFKTVLFALGSRTTSVADGFYNYAKCYGARYYRDGALVRDYIPVRVGSGASAVGYLYDRANPTGGPLGNGLYGNAGTGAFVIGPDKT